MAYLNSLLLFGNNLAIAYGCPLPNHSAIKKRQVNITVYKMLVFPVNSGIVNSVLEKILETHSIAIVIFSARKNIHANTVKANVIPIDKNSLIEGRYFPLQLHQYHIFLFEDYYRKHIKSIKKSPEDKCPLHRATNRSLKNYHSISDFHPYPPASTQRDI